MTAYASIQFCGANVQARVYQNGPYVMAELKDGASVTMEPQHIRDLAAALDRFEAIAALKHTAMEADAMLDTAISQMGEVHP